MQHHTHTALFTTVSGVVGGVGKAISAKLAVSGYIYSTRIGHSVSLELFNIRD
jgi:hypothetical protein